MIHKTDDKMSDSSSTQKDAVPAPSPQFFSVGVADLAVTFLKRGLGWLGIYLWGYWGFSPGYLLAPLFLSVMR